MVHAYVDGEFDEREQLECELHLSGCDSCRAQARQVSLFQHHLKASYTPEAAPDALKMRIMDALQAQVEQEEQEDAQTAIADLAASGPLPVLPSAALVAQEPASRGASAWTYAAAAVVIFGLGAMFWTARGDNTMPVSTAANSIEDAATYADEADSPASDKIVAQSVNLHRRNLPVEVTGPSGERVRYWFHGKVDFPVRLPRFDLAGHNQVNLLGARLSQLREQQAAYVVYEARGQKLSVMVFDGKPEAKNVARRPRPRRGREFYNSSGYNVAIVENNGVTYSITSELPQEDMVQLVNAAFQPKP